MQLKTFLKLYESKTRDFSRRDLRKLDLHNFDLSGMDFTEANLSYAILTDANLSNTILYGANLSNANLCRANLSGSILNCAKIADANFQKANLVKARFYRANLSFSNFSEADLSQCNLNETELCGTIFKNANLSRSQLFKANLMFANLSGSDLTEANLRKTNLDGADLNGTKIINADLCAANLEGVKGLSVENLKTAMIYDKDTVLPEGITWASFRNPKTGSEVQNSSSEIIQQMVNIEEKVESESYFDPETLSDAREKTFRAIALRKGQRKFRSDLLEVYKQCIITGCDVVYTLEAAHIHPYKGEETNKVWNGLLLRADIHNLFDLYLLTIEPEENKVHIAPELKNKKDYSEFQGKILTLSEIPNSELRKELLKWHYKQCTWTNFQ